LSAGSSSSGAPDSRPHVSNDNPFSESHFKTLKYRPQFPKCFGCKDHAQRFCRDFFGLYNTAHHHTGLGLMTPDQVHYGQADAIHAAPQFTLAAAFAAHPERFVNNPPIPPKKPTAAWINPPQNKAEPKSLN
jgi:putative transposase